MRLLRLATFFLAISTLLARAADVYVLGEMRRMFTAHDIAANVDLSKLSATPHVYALGPIAGLQGEITALDGEVFISQVLADRPSIMVNPKAKAIFLVYASVPKWRSVDLPATVATETDLASFLENKLPKNTRSPFLVRGTALAARYHIQNYTGKAEELTHQAHDQAKVFFELTNAPVELVGFFTSRDGDAGTFVHMGQKTHVHVLSKDRKDMGHLESVKLEPSAKLLLPNE